MKLDVPALFEKNGRYWYWRGVNWVAVGWVVLGFIISFYIPDAMIKTLSTIVITGVLYLATQLILKARVDVLAHAAAPIEIPVDEVALDLALIEQ
jgi:cytosine/uracil/thiamine/allantoin permease